MPNTYYDELFDSNGALIYAGMGYDRNGHFIFHGKGKLYDPDAGELYYEGDFKDDERTGKGKLYDDDGTLIYEGEFKDGDWDGKGKQYSEDGSLWYEGEFKGGRPNGKGKQYSEDGSLSYEGEFKDGDCDGRGKLYHKDGSLCYEGEFKNGDWDGKGKLYNPETGKLFYEGEFKNGTLDGKGKQYREDGSLYYEGEFKNDKANGKGKLYNEDGTLEYEGEFEDGEPVGAVRSSRSHQPRELSVCIEELNSMIGLEEVKAQVHSLVNLIRLQNERRARGMPVIPMSYHLVFTGNPGTGKTTVARLLAEIYANLGVVSKGSFVEVDRSGLVAGYLGQTALKTDKVIESARGGVLFIDEAYSLAQEEKDQYGMEAIDCLVKRMEDYRDDFVVIVAGYQEPMSRFLESNPGLKSRFNRYIHFENYSAGDLVSILKRFCDSSGYQLEPDCLPLFEEQIKKQMDRAEFAAHFSNGRYVRNVFEKMVIAQGNRLSTMDISQVDDRTLTLITTQDLRYVINSHEFEKTS